MKYKCTKENKIIYKIHHRLQRNLFTKKIHLRLQMLPFASLCSPDNIIPISEASMKIYNLFCFVINTLCASSLNTLSQSTCLIKLSTEFRAVSIRGVIL